MNELLFNLNGSSFLYTSEVVLHSILSFIQWNPSREAFRIPYFDHPVTWYGILFVTGFFIGYLILIPIIQRKLDQTKSLLDRDILSWSDLIKELKDRKSDEVFELLPTQDQKAIVNLKGEPNHLLKISILKALNQSPLSRSKLEQMFPNSIGTTKEMATQVTEQLTWFVVIGTVVGARLGNVFFYDWPRYKNNLIEIFKVWNGGLASHGGVIGIMLAIIAFRYFTKKKYPELTVLTVLDSICIPGTLVGVFIRIGNFVNQEILGPPTSAPWAVVFGNPADRSAPVPRHPTQIYEAFAYLLCFGALYWIWKQRSDRLKPGFMVGLFFIMIFSCRFLIEFLKVPMSMMIDESFLQTGQLLSIPFILLGIAFILFGERIDRCNRWT